MAIDKSKYDKLDKDYTKSCISEYYEDWDDFYPEINYLEWQEDFSYYNYDYYINSDGIKMICWV